MNPPRTKGGIMIVTLVMFLAAGCASQYDSGNARIASPDAVQKIQVGRTTKAEVRSVFGESKSVTTKAEGVETWDYTFTHADPGFFSAKGEAKTISITFNRAGVVEAVSDKRTVSSASLFGVHTTTVGESGD